MFKFSQKLFLICYLFLSSVVAFGQDCSDCATANCLADFHTNYQDADDFHTNWSPATSSQFCTKFLPEISGPSTRFSYHTVTAGSAGIIGAVISNYETPFSCSSPRTYELYAISGDCLSSSSPENLISNNANGSDYGNPEWDGLTPGQDYILKIQYDIASGCNMGDQCVTVYAPSTVLGIQDGELNTINIYPNPTKGKVYFNNNNQVNITYKIINVQGVILEMKESSSQEDYFDFSNYVSGTYLIEVNDGKTTHHYKIIKE